MNFFNECFSKLQPNKYYVIQNSLDAGIQDSSTSISIVVKFEEMSESDDDDGDESDKHI